MKDDNIDRAQNSLIKAQFDELTALRRKVRALEAEKNLAWTVVEHFLKEHGAAVVRAEDMNKCEFNISIDHNIEGEVLLKWNKRSNIRDI